MYQCHDYDRTFAHCKMETKCVRGEHFSSNKYIYINLMGVVVVVIVGYLGYQLLV